MLKTGHFPTVITSTAIEVCVSAEGRVQRTKYNKQNTPLHPQWLNKRKPHKGFTDITLQL
jgi:hypothetical protein